MRLRSRIGWDTVIRVTMVVVSGVNALVWVTQALISPAWLPVLIGTGLAVAGVILYLRFRLVFPLIALILCAIGGWLTIMTTVVLRQHELLTIVHTLWVLLFFGGMIARPIVRRASRNASERLGAQIEEQAKQQRIAAAREAEEQRIAANRQREIEYARQIEREQNWTQHATRPGAMTGYEPAELAAIEVRGSDRMFGDPGAGLSGAGFSESAVKRGQEGEMNFARSLVKAGQLDRFAIFWSVHMPDSEVGANTTFSGDIDCVVVTGTSVWLLDMKNYNQGDVTWRVETRKDGNRDRPVLVALDNATGGYVGEPRPMTRNMKMATEIFAKKFSETGLPYHVRPAVVLMPRAEGMGVVDDVKWPGDIPAAALPHVLEWLKAESEFDPAHPDAQLITMILKVLVKDESGSAPLPGQQRVGAASASATRKFAGLPRTRPPRQTDMVSTEPAPSSDARLCRDCSTPLADGQTLCFTCGLVQ